MVVVRPFFGIAGQAVGVHNVTAEAVKYWGGIRQNIVHTAEVISNCTLPRRSTVGSTESPTCQDSLSLSEGKSTCTAETEGAEAALNIKERFTAEGFSGCSFIAVVSVETLFKNKACAVTIAEIFNTLDAPAGALAETGVQFDFVVAVFSFLDDHAFFDDTVESDVRSSKSQRGECAKNAHGDKCFFHLSSTPIEVIKLAESSNS